MNRLDLEYGPIPRYGYWLSMLGLALTVLLGAKLMDRYLTEKSETAALQARVTRNDARAHPGQSAALSESLLREIRRANDVIEQIGLPWDRLFRAVESAAGERIALLGITPEPKAGTVEIGGEAADLGAMFDYVKRLQRQPSLAKVYLLHHKINDHDPQHPVVFSVIASWAEQPSAR